VRIAELSALDSFSLQGLRIMRNAHALQKRRASSSLQLIASFLLLGTLSRDAWAQPPRGDGSVSRTGNATPQESQRVEKEIAAVAKAQGLGVYGFRSTNGTYLVVTGGPYEVVFLDLNLLGLYGALKTKVPFDAPDVKKQLLALAQQLSTEGVRQRAAENYPAAFQLERFALYIAVRYHHGPALDATTANYRVLQQSIVQSLRFRSPPPSLDRAADHNQEEGLKALQSQIRSDAATLLPVLRKAVNEARDPKSDEVCRALAWVRRLAATAGDTQLSRQTLFSIEKRATGPDQQVALLLETLDELSQVKLAEVLTATGILDKETREGLRRSLDWLERPNHSDRTPSWDSFSRLLAVVDRPGLRVSEDEDKSHAFARLWGLFSERQNLLSTPAAHAPELLGSAYQAFEHFEHLRIVALAAGTSFGARLSYAVARYLQPLGRACCYLAWEQGQHEFAFLLSERLHARAMADWAARTHASTRLVLNRHVSGSISEVRPAAMEEVQAAMHDNGASILSYLRVHDGYLVWFLDEGKAIVADHIQEPTESVQNIWRMFDCGVNVEQIAKTRRGLDGLEQKRQQSVDSANDLSALYSALIPQNMRDALKGTKRLIVIADGILDYVPFCALRREDGTFIVEKCELLYWPSVTCWLLIRESVDHRRQMLKDASPKPQALVIGGSTFDYEVQLAESGKSIRLPQLIGAEQEARIVAGLLGVEPTVGSSATIQRIFAVRQGAPVLHLATHGILNINSPEQSFLAMSDGPLMANALYQYDPGVRPSLVVLSACRTALGSGHLDSAFGLTNAFIIAGANTVGSTLWQVPDIATVSLMTRFYSELKMVHRWQARCVPPSWSHSITRA
jgi:CHAT domain-containing protein